MIYGCFYFKMIKHFEFEFEFDLKIILGSFRFEKIIYCLVRLKKNSVRLITNNYIIIISRDAVYDTQDVFTKNKIRIDISVISAVELLHNHSTSGTHMRL